MNFKVNESSQKLRGGYYTPGDLADFLTKWVMQAKPTSILEPSCGDGVFLRAVGAQNRSRKSTILGFELDRLEAAKAAETNPSARVETADFLGWAIKALASGESQFDAVLGNPPFIRYQYLPPEFQARAEAVFKLLQIPFTKHTNAWVPFILAAFALLRPGGRLAMVVPAEIINVMHAQGLRSYLGEHASRLVVVDPEELWFPNTLQGAVLLMAQKKRTAREFGQGLGIYQVRGREFARLDPASVFDAPRAINGKTVEGKWTRALLDVKTRSLLDGIAELPSVHVFRDIAEVDVGIVTGANKYFLVTDEVVNQYELERWAHPMFGRSEHCPGIVYDAKQHRVNASVGNPTNFIWFKDRAVENEKGPRSYIRYGEGQNLHSRYKCRVRRPWYSVPSVYTTEIGMLKRSHHTPRLILNKVGAYTTDTAYRIRSATVGAERFVYCFVNALTALSAELEGRHYGGGVLELVPSEIEKMLVPVPTKVRVKLAQLDQAVRSMTADDLLLSQSRELFGLLDVSKNDQDRLLAGWQHLRNRRHRVSAVETEGP